METSSNNDSTASPATTARSSTIHNYQGIKKHLIEAIVFSADTVFACRERLISYDNNDELTCKVDALFHRSKRSSPYLSSHAAREIRRQEYCEGNGNGNQDDYDSLRVKFFDTTSTCPSTNPSVSFPSDFYYSSIDNDSKSSRNSRRKKRKQLEAIPDVPSSLLRLLDVQHDNNNEFVEQPPSKTTTLLSLSAKTTAAADDITMTTKKSSSSKPRIRNNKRRLLHDFIMNHIVCFKGKTTKSVVLESIQKEMEEKEKNENENHYHHQLHSHSHCHHNHHLSSTNTNTTIASLFHDDDDADADHDDDDDVNKKGSNTTHRRSRRRKNKKSFRHIMGVSYSPSTATATTTNRTLCWQRRPASYQPFEQRRSCCVVMGS